jgi:hypothetical protein
MEVLVHSRSTAAMADHLLPTTEATSRLLHHNNMAAMVRQAGTHHQLPMRKLCSKHSKVRTTQFRLAISPRGSLT